MTTTPDSPATPDSPDGDGPEPHAPVEAGAPRRIAIGTQRPGVKPPSLAPRVEYTTPATPAAVPPAAASGVVSAGPTTEAPAAPAGAPPGKGDRDAGKVRRRDTPRGPRADVAPPPSRRVAVPNVRTALDDELSAEFDAALAGVEIDELLDASATGRLEAPLEPGTRALGTVLSVGPDTAFIDLGGRRQGALKLAALVEAGLDLPAVGSAIEVAVGGRNDDDNLYDIALAHHAIAVEDWSQIQAGMIVAAKVTAANKGGLECEVAGLRGFMPASLVSVWRVENLEEMVGQTLDSLVTEIVPAARRLVLSRRAVIEKQAADAKVKMLETLEPGTELEGTVRSVRDFGAFVDIGSGVEGLVHVSELSWDRVAKPADVLQPGQKVRVIVKRIDRQTGKIGLSARDLVESPWKRAAVRYHVGATVRGTVSRIAQFGAFVKLEPGVEGLVHVSELATRHVRSVSDVVREGQEVECRVMACDPEAQRIGLSIKALAPAPAMKPAGRDEEPVAEEPVAPPPAKKRSAPLQGGLGGGSQGEKFGLRW
ncbi:MAG: S1 RNA-binding domain-containing protein [Planctomycetaceae bacterium]